MKRSTVELTTEERRILQLERAAEERTTVPQTLLSKTEVLELGWLKGAACRDSDPEIFHPALGSDRRPVEAEKVCAGCPFNQPCRDYRYMIAASGVWGGVNYAYTSTGLRNRTAKCVALNCPNPHRTGSRYCGFECEHRSKVGSLAGAKLHHKFEVPLCPACTEARRAADARAVPRAATTAAA